MQHNRTAAELARSTTDSAGLRKQQRFDVEVLVRAAKEEITAAQAAQRAVEKAALERKFQEQQTAADTKYGELQEAHSEVQHELQRISQKLQQAEHEVRSTIPMCC